VTPTFHPLLVPRRFISMAEWDWADLRGMVLGLRRGDFVVSEDPLTNRLYMPTT